VCININHADYTSVSHHHKRLQQPLYHAHRIEADEIQSLKRSFQSDLLELQGIPIKQSMNS
jgi:hypothetical protein